MKTTTRVQREDGTWEFIDTTNTQINEERFDAKVDANMDADAVADADADANANEDATADANADNKVVEKEKEKDIIAPHDDPAQEKKTDASEDTQTGFELVSSAFSCLCRSASMQIGEEKGKANSYNACWVWTNS